MERNSENESLQRIYGTAWAKEKELKDYLTRIEEAEKEIIENLVKTFTISYTRRISRNDFLASKWMDNLPSTEKYIREILKKNDYLEIKTPQAVDKSLWEKSVIGRNLETICSLLHQKIELMQLNQ